MNEMIDNQINEKWHLLLWKIFAVICGIIILSEWMLIFAYSSDAKPEMEKGYYIITRAVVPTIIELAILLISRYLLKNDRLDIGKKNWLISFMMFLILATAAYVHFKILPIILLPGAAIVATALFADNGITIVMTLLNLTSIIIDNIRVMHYYSWSRSDLIGNMIMAMAIAIELCVLVIVINEHTGEMMDSIIDSYRKQKSLSAEMKKDPMTGLYNRRSFEETLEKEIENVEQTGKKAFIAIFDIDHFKNVNDTYGHANGDVVIKALCKMMQEKSQKNGIAFRYGGEEFVILFSDIELPKVINIVEDIRTEFRCYYFQFMLKDGITCSCGIAEYQQGESSKAWFNRADTSLYKAKEAGRNRTVISE